MKILRNAGVIDGSLGMYPARLHLLDRARSFEDASTTLYGAVVRGRASLRASGIRVDLDPGGFFGLCGPCDFEIDGQAMVIERPGYRALTCVGRIEERGRLVYIDGCSDSVLCMPARLGDPVLNHLHFPARTRQTTHVHPTVRLGVVVRGEGLAMGPRPDGTGDWEEPLEPGTAFLLSEHEPHAFRTSSRGSMDVVAFHPDSDWGPTDSAHPMLNRTYVLGRAPRGS